MNLSRPVLVTVLLCGALIGVALTMLLGRESVSVATAPGEPVLLPVTASAGGASRTNELGLPDFTKLVERLKPSVVNISTQSDEASRLTRRHGFVDPFEFYFRGPRRSLGSGFIFDGEGYIITNHHVVEDASKIVVKLADGEEHEAELIGSDAKTDLAVIKIDAVEGLEPISLGDSSNLAVGEWVLTIGNPFGLDNTVTAGIVSAKGRQINRRNPYDDFIQTDAAINPGNSGGPLVNLAGQVVGINTAIFSSSGGNIGIGFAIPINMARQIVPQLKADGHVTRGWFGVKIQPVDDDIAASLDLPAASGALVAEVFADSPAADAEIMVGDVIVEFDSVEVPESGDLPTIVAATPVGKQVKVVLIRAGKRQSIDVTVGKLRDGAGEARTVKAGALGLSVQDLTAELIEQLGLEEGASGVVVTSVETGSPADEAGLHPGDVIEMVGNRSVESADHFRERLSVFGEEESVLVLVRRGSQTLFRVIKPARG